MRYKFLAAIVGIVLLIFLVSAVPQLLVNSPSSSPFYTTNTSVELNFSIIESNLGSLIYNWNGTNFTFYDSSLVLMMNFDNRSGLGENDTYAIDVSRYGNNGTLINGTIWNSSGKYNGALEFDGVDDYMGVVNSESLNTANSNSSNYTISFWTKTTMNGADIWTQPTFIDFRNTGDDPYEGWVFSIFLNAQNTTGFLTGGAISPAYPAGYWDIINGSTIINDGDWHHISVVKKNTESIKIYVDGFEDATGSSDKNFSTNELMTIGCRRNDAGGYRDYFNGSIDEVRIWNRSLSASEIYQQYASNLNKFNLTQWNFYVNQSKNATAGLDYGIYTYQTFATNTSGSLNSTDLRTIKIQSDIIFPLVNFTSPTPQNATTTSNTSFIVNVSINEQNLNSVIYNWNGTNFTFYNSSLVLMMNFDNRSELGENDTYVIDVSGYENNGTLGNLSTITQPTWNSSGKYNGAFEFGGNKSYIKISNSQFKFGSNPFSVSFWFNANEFGNGNTKKLISCTESGGWSVGFESSYLQFVFHNGSYMRTFYPESSLTTNEWYYVTGIWNTTNILLYVDGILVDTNSTTGSLTSHATAPLCIGSEATSTGCEFSTWYFNGSIDVVRIWNRTLSTAEIYQQYASNLNKFNLTQWNLYVTQSKNATAGLDYGTYNYQIFATDDSGNLNSTEQRIITAGAIYPIFSNYSDNNASLTGSGIGLFNVTVLNTNGTVWLRINNTNYTASNLTSNIYNVSVNLTSGIYNYTWYSYGNGSTNLLNNSETKYYTVNATSVTPTTETIAESPKSSSGGGGGNYILEQNTKTEELRIRTWISPNKTVTTKIKEDKRTGIKEIELKSKNWLSGAILIVAYNETPDFCSIEYGDEHKVYKVLDFNNTIKSNSIDSGRLKIGIQKNWIYGNNISEIKFVRCYPQYEEMKSSYESETDSEGIYNVYISGFSAYAILGTLAINKNKSTSEEKKWSAESKNYNLDKIFLWILIGVVIIVLILLLVKHRIYLKEKIHSKFFDFEFKFRIGK